MTFSNILLGITTFCTALMAGLFYSYSCSVMLGLKTLTDLQFIESMQAINKAIQNPVFFLAFFGTLLFLPANIYFHYSHPATTQFWLFVIAGILYVAGVFCVTVLGNIPLNNSLDRFQVSNASTAAIHVCRVNFEGSWNRLNTIRTISSVFSLIFIIIGCISKGGKLTQIGQSKFQKHLF